MEVIMKKPTKKAFYEYMSLKMDTKYKEQEGYEILLDVILTAESSESSFMDLVELTLMNKTDRLIYRNQQACAGTEMTPKQVEEALMRVPRG